MEGAHHIGNDVSIRRNAILIALLYCQISVYQLLEKVKPWKINVTVMLAASLTKMAAIQFYPRKASHCDMLHLVFYIYGNVIPMTSDSHVVMSCQSAGGNI